MRYANSCSICTHNHQHYHRRFRCASGEASGEPSIRRDPPDDAPALHKCQHWEKQPPLLLRGCSGIPCSTAESTPSQGRQTHVGSPARKGAVDRLQGIRVHRGRKTLQRRQAAAPQQALGLRSA
ncbi:hypothetical protein LEMLEM_LOCUS3740 [Lemmus lemmus]